MTVLVSTYVDRRILRVEEVGSASQEDIAGASTLGIPAPEFVRGGNVRPFQLLWHYVCYRGHNPSQRGRGPNGVVEDSVLHRAARLTGARIPADAARIETSDPGGSYSIPP